MSRYRLIPRQVSVTREGRKPLTHYEIGEAASSHDRSLVLANPEERPGPGRYERTYRHAIHVGPEFGGQWILVYTSRPGEIDTACEIAVDFACDRWPGCDQTPTAEDLDSALVDAHRDRLRAENIDPASMSDAEILAAYEISDEQRWEASDSLTEGCISDGSGRCAQVNSIQDLSDRDDLIQFLYPYGPTLPQNSRLADKAIRDRHMQGPIREQF